MNKHILSALVLSLLMVAGSGEAKRSKSEAKTGKPMDCLDHKIAYQEHEHKANYHREKARLHKQMHEDCVKNEARAHAEGVKHYNEAEKEKQRKHDEAVKHHQAANKGHSNQK